MEQPCKGASRERLLELFKKRVFYYVNESKGGYYLKPCVLDREGAWHPSTPYIICFDENMSLENFKICVGWENLFDSWNEAEKRVEHIEKLFTKGFYKKPFVTISTLEKYKGEMVRIEKLINERLKDYPNFLGIDFCDVNAHGIQITGHHKEIKHYVFGSQPTIKYDFANKEEVITEFVEMWKEKDTPSSVSKYKKFIEIGESLGWD